MIEKGTDNHINKVPVSPSSNEIQKIGLCGTAHYLMNEKINKARQVKFEKNQQQQKIKIKPKQ